MKKNILLFIFFCSFNYSYSQPFAQWGKLEQGPYNVGYKDTVLFKTNENFTYHNYNGNKPFFVSIWYPAMANPTLPYMTLKNYFEYPSKSHYATLYDSLINSFHDIFIKDGICINLNSYDDIAYDAAHKNIYNEVLASTVNAKRNLTALKQKFPCIIYHHGAQSTPFDNNVFCEYMASFGFMVVSSTYNLPDIKNSGHLIFASDSDFGLVTDLSFIVNSVKKMDNVDTTKMVAVGHSLGAQAALLHDNESTIKPFKTMISFHTTMEDKSTEDIKNGWKYFNYLINNQCKLSTTPTALFAPSAIVYVTDSNEVTGKVINYMDTIYPKFTPFKNNTTSPYTFITVKHNVSHDGFIALGNLRQPYIEKYKLTDGAEQIKQQHHFEEIIVFAKQIAIAATSYKAFPDEQKIKANFIITHNAQVKQIH